MTMTAVDDVAAALDMDPVELFRMNLDLVGRYGELYDEQLTVASKMMGWKKDWRPRSVMSNGPLQRGLGVSIHTWGGRGHRSNCEVVLHSDGSIEARIGTQDLGTGTRSIIAAVVAETFGVGLEDVEVQMGDSRFPQSGPSGGSSTVGG